MKTEKQNAIDLALSKLTTKEKELLGLVKKKVKPKVKKNYKLKIEYMIGDANGYTNKEATISINNPFLKIITRALDKLEVCKGSWGLQLKNEDYKGNYRKKNINKLEYDLLCLVSGYSYEDDTAIKFFKNHGFEDSDENHNYLQEFEGLLIEEAEYSFLVYQEYKLR